MRTRARILCLYGMICALAISSESAFSDQPFTSSPLGVQRVLVIPVEFPVGNPCPNANENCPKGLTTWYPQQVGPPRHTPAEWANLLNSIAGKWWQQTSYDQSKFEFTVLSDPQTADGWWPAPHSIQDYARNNGNWYLQTNNPPSFALVPDVTANVVQSICNASSSGLLQGLACGLLTVFNRVVILQNFHAFGDQSLGNDYPFTIATGTSLGNLVVSASWANEDATDNGITSLMHELGHQSGELSHYGNCGPYFSFSSFNSTLPSGSVECITGWDIMGLSYSFSEFSGYSRVSRGWINASSTPSFDLISSGPFAQTYVMNPLELAPTNSNPDVIRLSIGDLSWPEFAGYFVECRKQLNGDVSAPFPSIPVGTIPDQGVLITDVHEFSLSDIPGAPAHHVERALLPNDQLANATLKPGQTFSVPILGLSVRFNGYVGRDSQQCSVSVSHLKPLPHAPPNKIIFAGSVLTNGITQARDTASISADIAVNTLIAAEPKVSVAVPLAPLWPGHVNPILIRVHNRSTGPVEGVTLAVNVQQPAVIKNPCNAEPAKPNLGTVQLTTIGAGSSGLAAMNWKTADDSSASIDVTAKGPANQIHTASRFAFQFHHQDSSDQGIRTQFKIAADASCMMAETYFIGPAVSLPDWQVEISPQTVTLKPGDEAVVTVLVKPPTKRQAGLHAEIPIVIRMPQQMLADTSGIPVDTPENFMPGVHYMAMGTMTILAKVTEGPGSVSLTCKSAADKRGNSAGPCIGHAHHLLEIQGAVSPHSANSSVSIEYRSPAGETTAHVVMTDGDGGYHDTFVPPDRGRWLIQSRWAGGDVSDPTESSLLPVDVQK
jgi:hypothetical protein